MFRKVFKTCSFVQLEGLSRLAKLMPIFLKLAFSILPERIFFSPTPSFGNTSPKLASLVIILGGKFDSHDFRALSTRVFVCVRAVQNGNTAREHFFDPETEIRNYGRGSNSRLGWFLQHTHTGLVSSAPSKLRDEIRFASSAIGQCVFLYDRKVQSWLLIFLIHFLYIQKSKSKNISNFIHHRKQHSLQSPSE